MNLQGNLLWLAITALAIVAVLSLVSLLGRRRSSARKREWYQEFLTELNSCGGRSEFLDIKRRFKLSQDDFKDKDALVLWRLFDERERTISEPEAEESAEAASQAKRNAEFQDRKKALASDIRTVRELTKDQRDPSFEELHALLITRGTHPSITEIGEFLGSDEVAVLEALYDIKLVSYLGQLLSDAGNGSGEAWAKVIALKEALVEAEYSSRDESDFWGLVETHFPDWDTTMIRYTPDPDEDDFLIPPSDLQPDAIENVFLGAKQGKVKDIQLARHLIARMDETFAQHVMADLDHQFCGLLREHYPPEPVGTTTCQHSEVMEGNG